MIGQRVAAVGRADRPGPCRRGRAGGPARRSSRSRRTGSSSGRATRRAGTASPAGRAARRTPGACRRSTRRAGGRPRRARDGRDRRAGPSAVDGRPTVREADLAQLAVGPATSVSGPIGRVDRRWWQVFIGFNLPGRGGTSGEPADATHRWCRAYERHGRQRSARVGVEAEHVEADADAEVGRQEHVGVAEPAHQHVAGRPRTDAGHVEQRRGDVVAVGADVEHELARRRRGGPARRSCAGGCAASAASPGRARRAPPAVGNTCVTGRRRSTAARRPRPRCARSRCGRRRRRSAGR